MEALEGVIAQYHLALDQFMRGDPALAIELFSQRDDVTLANPFDPTARGWESVQRTVEAAARNCRDGRAVHFESVAEVVTAELAYLHEVEHLESKVGTGDDLVPLALRVTSVFRPESGTWKLVHRHADPITTPRSPESVTQT